MIHRQKVRDLLSAPSKWCQGTPNPPRTYCLGRAIIECYGAIDAFPIWKRVTRHVYNGLIGWNDTPGRTFEDVRGLVEAFDL